MFEIPTSIRINEIDYPIRNRGDYRVILDCFSALNDLELDRSYQIMTCLIIFYDGLCEFEDVSDTFGDYIQDAIKEMFKFFNCGQEEKFSRPTPKLIDWEQDQQMIASAINKVAGKEIRFEPYLHWWTFMGYYNAIGESTLSHVVSIRHKIKAHKKLEKYEEEFRRDNPQYFMWEQNLPENRQVEDYIRDLWNSGG